MALNGQKHFFAEKMRLLEPTAQIWIKIDPYNLQQKCSPMILVSGNIRFMGIFAGILLGGGIKWEWGSRSRQFLVIWMATSSESSEIRPATLHYDMLTLVGDKWRQKRMTLNDFEWLFAVKIRFGKHSVAAKMRLLEPIAQIWMTIDLYNLRQKCSPMILVSGNIKFMGIFAGVPLGGGVK